MVMLTLKLIGRYHAGESMRSRRESQHGAQRPMVDGSCDDLAAHVTLENRDALDLHASESRCTPLQVRRRRARFGREL
jgi:hypothetical protein